MAHQKDIICISKQFQMTDFSLTTFSAKGSILVLYFRKITSD
jgi:high-affinity K+ transport system ATPase subunit B